MLKVELFFDRIKEHQEKDLPFVVYRPPSNNRGFLRGFFQRSSVVYKTEGFSESGFVFAPFDSGKEAILFPKEFCEILETVFNDPEDLSVPAITEEAVPGTNADKEKHLDLVQKGIDAIIQGRLKKVVLSRKEKVQTANLESIVLFQRLLKKYPDAFVYLMHHPQVGTWLGATPEALLHIERSRVRTMALAGTQKYTGDKEVVWGQKEKEEQQIVTDIILEGLQETCRNFDTHGPYSSRAGNLLHLRTDITAEIVPDRGDLKKIIYSIHPTPAICGHPLEPARAFIVENEDYDREFYAGFLGEINMIQEVKRSANRRNQENQAYSSLVSKTSLFVNLRCMKIHKDAVEIFVGGGITKESIPGAEWEETQHKAQTMKAVLF